MQKCVCFFLLVFLVNTCYSQKYSADFNSIDWNVQFIDAPSADSLAVKLTSSYKTEIEKVRAIFTWITDHISYNVNIFNSRRPLSIIYNSIKEDTSATWKSANEMVADRVLQRRVAVCDGYSKLFKTLCDYSGLRSEIIIGYASGYMGRGGGFMTNHSWNAVMIDSTWHLLDVTWASGYINYDNEFVQHFEESYFLTPPERFIMDHYPEDLQWTLLSNPPTAYEFRHHPFKYKTFFKYRINSYYPSKGVIEASQGDTVHIEIESMDTERDKKISSDPFFDSAILTRSDTWKFLDPVKVEKHKVLYTFIVDSSITQWLHVMYNNDLILRYKLYIRNNTVRK